MKTKLSERRGYAYVIYALCFLMIFFGLGFFSTGRGIFLTPITEALSIKRSAFAIGDSIRYITNAAANFFFGYFVNKFGTKKLICVGFISLITAVLLYASASGVIGFYIAGIFLGIGYTCTTTTMVGCVVAKWCHKNVGAVTGVILAANGIGGAVSTQLFTPIIYESKFGYRNAYYITTSILVAVLILMLVFYKEKPTPVGFSEKKKPKGDVTWPGLSLKEALKKPLFYIVLFCVFLIGVVLQGITSVYAAHLKDVGFDAGFVATVVGIHSITLAVSKIISGFIYDKFGIRVNILVCTVAGIVALFSFLSLGNSAACTALAIVAAVTFAFALPLETVMLPLFTGNFFGLKDYNKILGIVCSVAAVGFATGVPLMNAVYDVFGSYFYGLVAAIVLMFTVTVTMQFAINISNRLKKETEV